MKIAYFDCFNGISGDMTVAAFLDAGLKLALLKKRLGLLNLSGYKIDVFKKEHCGICATKFNVTIEPKRHLMGSTHNEIKKIISKSRLSSDIKTLSLSIFGTLASAEARVHNGPKADVHFHEIGDMDSIIDIVSTAIAVREFGIERFYCLNLKLGKGSVYTRHGCLPLPAPAVLEMFRGRVAVAFSDIEYELVTPTGGAILTTLVEDFKSQPEIGIEAIGYGAGSFKLEGQPNILRLVIGDSKKGPVDNEEITVIETNIDDMSPVYCEYIIERLFREGALDVYLTSVYMKKTRPAILLTLLAREPLVDKLARTIFEETTSSGLRYYKVQRKVLARCIKTVKTKYGMVKVKVNSDQGGIKTVSPEYEDCKRVAQRTGLPIKMIFDEVRKELK